MNNSEIDTQAEFSGCHDTGEGLMTMLSALLRVDGDSRSCVLRRFGAAGAMFADNVPYNSAAMA
jgi:hypothetical protein